MHDAVTSVLALLFLFALTGLIMAWAKRRRRDDYRDLMRKYYRGRKHFAK